MIIKEFRIPMPLTLDEYQIGQGYTFSIESLNNTGGGEGIEVIKSEHFENIPLHNGKLYSGQYTQKIYHMGRALTNYLTILKTCRYIDASKAPGFIQLIMPKGSLDFYEESWNAFPYFKTVVTNKLMKDDFKLIIESIHCPGGPHQENALSLPEDKLKLREVVHIDIANDEISAKDYKRELDPTLYASRKSKRGPLNKDWLIKANPVMTCYKLVTVEFKWFGLQTRVENHIMNTEQRVFTLFHRQIFCLLDEWIDMGMEDIREFEEKVKRELDRLLQEGERRGMTAE